MNRRTFLTRLGTAAAAAPFVSSLGAAERPPTAASPSFISRLQPAVVGGGFELPDHWVWCGAPIRGEAYRYVEQIEAYGPSGVPYSKLGLWLTLENEADHGLVNMLLEMHYDFVPADEKNLDRLYSKHGVRLHRQLLQNALDLLDSTPVLKVTGLPSSGRVSLLRQADKNRYVAHLLYSPALQRGEVKVIEDFPPIPGVKLAVRVPERVTKVRTIPAGETLAFTQDAGVLTIAVPTFTMHTGIVLEYQTTP